MENKFRCDCPISSSLDILGDKWVLVIVKQMLIEGKQTFKDFAESREAIASNILTAKLKWLNTQGIVTKSKLPSNKKSIYYHLTEKGMSLAPIIVELSIWSDSYLREQNPTMWDGEDLVKMKGNKDEYIKELIENYKEMLAQFTSVGA